MRVDQLTQERMKAVSERFPGPHSWTSAWTTTCNSSQLWSKLSVNVASVVSPLNLSAYGYLPGAVVKRFCLSRGSASQPTYACQPLTAYPSRVFSFSCQTPISEWSCDTCCCAAECGEWFFCSESMPQRTCFLELGFNKMGWTNGPFGVDEDFFLDLPIYQAEDECEGSGQHTAGSEVNYTAGVWELKLQTRQGYAIGDWHAYVGCDPLPRDRQNRFTTAPGKYPYADTFKGDTIEATFTDTLDQSCDEFYVVVHAEIHEWGHGKPKETAFMRTCAN